MPAEARQALDELEVNLGTVEVRRVLFEQPAKEIGGLGNAVSLGADGGAVVQRGPLPPTLTHELGFRFTLQADTVPGNYPWPLQLSVRPIS